MSDLDEIDRRILQVLVAEGRITNAALAERVNLSPSACLRRVQELERSGIITGYRAKIDRRQLGIGLVVFVTVGLSEHTKKAQSAFEKAMAGAEEVIECHNVSGAFEYLLRVEVGDLAAYKRFHLETLGTLPQVTSITSYFCMASPKDERS